MPVFDSDRYPKTAALCPYNFVPFPPHNLCRYLRPSDIPAHNDADPHLYTGELVVTVRACTPLFISEGPNSSSFFRNLEGYYCIPGSTMRGLVRSAMNILSLAPVQGAADIPGEKDHLGNRRTNDAEYQMERYRPYTAGLPAENISSAACISYPQALLGFTTKAAAVFDQNGAVVIRPDGHVKTEGKKVSYRSRVSFGNLCAVGTPMPMGERSLILKTPQLHHSKHYSEDGRDWDDPDGFCLRGHKQYLLRDLPGYDVGGNSTIAPLPEGTQFRGTIHFHNLTDDELGLLLWSIRLDEGCYHVIGMGKPYGYGRSRISVDHLRLCTRNLYSLEGLCGGLTEEPSEKIEDLIQIYIKKATELWNEAVKPSERISSLRELSVLQDFFFLRSMIFPVSIARYMRKNGAVDEYAKRPDPLPTAAFLRNATAQPQGTTASPHRDPPNPVSSVPKKKKKESVPKAKDTPAKPQETASAEALAALAAKYKKKH